MNAESASPDIGLTHIALPVTDLDTSIAFYAEFAKMQVVHRRPQVVWLSDKTRPFVLVLIQSPDVEFPMLPFAHLGVACGSPAEVDQLTDRARDDLCLIAGPMDYGPPVGYWAFIRDPDGHTLELSFGQQVGVTVDDS